MEAAKSAERDKDKKIGVSGDHLASKQPELLPELWNRVFSFLSPDKDATEKEGEYQSTLASLMRVSKLFNSLAGPHLYRNVRTTDMLAFFFGIPPLQSVALPWFGNTTSSPLSTASPPSDTTTYLSPAGNSYHTGANRFTKMELLGFTRSLHIPHTPSGHAPTSTTSYSKRPDPSFEDLKWSSRRWPQLIDTLNFHAQSRNADPGHIFLPRLEMLRIGGEPGPVVSPALPSLVSSCDNIGPIITSLSNLSFVCDHNDHIHLGWDLLNRLKDSLYYRQPPTYICHVAADHEELPIIWGCNNIIYVEPSSGIRDGTRVYLGTPQAEADESDIEEALEILTDSILSAQPPQLSQPSLDCTEMSKATRVTVYGLIRRYPKIIAPGSAGLKWLYGDEGDGDEDDDGIDMLAEREAREYEDSLLNSVHERFMDNDGDDDDGSKRIVYEENVQILSTREAKDNPCPCCGKDCD